mmetsp:Transcript_26992/g.67911  ORF Transcript_26992/g.67911 Transcript_26992/m.67911 type:complete len:139 (+) Transcript_26992:302-718(+)
MLSLVTQHSGLVRLFLLAIHKSRKAPWLLLSMSTLRQEAKHRPAMVHLRIKCHLFTKLLAHPNQGLSSLSTVKPIKLPLQLSNLDVNVANESTGDLMEEAGVAIHAVTGANPAGALIAATPLLRLRDLQAGQTLIGIP